MRRSALPGWPSPPSRRPRRTVPCCTAAAGWADRLARGSLVVGRDRAARRPGAAELRHGRVRRLSAARPPVRSSGAAGGNAARGQGTGGMGGGGGTAR